MPARAPPPLRPQYCDRGTLGDAVDRGWLRTRPRLDAPPNLLAVLLTAQARRAVGFSHVGGGGHRPICRAKRSSGLLAALPSIPSPPTCQTRSEVLGTIL